VHNRKLSDILDERG